MHRPSLRQLDLFAQMVAAGSLDRCANELGLAAADIAAELAALELRLGYPLFEDLEGAARLTPAGHKTAQAMALLAHDAPAPRPAPDIVAPPPAAPPRPTILLAAPAPVFGHLQEALSTFEAANDDVAIALDLHVQSAADAAAALRDGRADIAYFYALGESPGLPSRYGWSEQLNLYAGTDHPLATEASVSREALARTPALMLDRDNPMRALLESALERGRATLGAPTVETDDMTAIIGALRNGKGIFAAFGPLARDLGRMPDIRRLALDMPLPAIEIRQAVSAQASRKPGVDALSEFLFL
ncbi:substrate-binding domain-containing protein [Sphingobium sp. OAS761]|uniref:substrate-binding domain-containing protein n=1 Tax=Sphingobium sp. OAS761 TaxID=2817901 RepID=UPI00209CDFEE|nr:substrate-binding domain-containing protein [Sphingobium sp. OAS761]